MIATITPSILKGEIASIPSKSAAHRLIICAALSKGETQITCPSLSADIEATAACMQALGAGVRYENGVYTITPIQKVNRGCTIDVGESGSTLRFLLPVVCALGAQCRIRMHGRLPQRPMSPLWEELEAHGCVLSRPAEDIIAVDGEMKSGSYTIAADVSSQFISGLLFALPLLQGESTVTLTGAFESASYVDMTRLAQKSFGVETSFDGRVFRFMKTRYVSPGNAFVEGDWSNAAFWLCADAIGTERITVTGLDEGSAQGDRAAVQALREIRSGDCVIDAQNIPDLVPILSVCAAVSKGTTEFIHAGRLRIKESDRLRAVAEMLSALGADVQEKPEGLLIKGKEFLQGGNVTSSNDHRMAMCAAIAATACRENVVLSGAEAVKKSYPAFWRDYALLGGKVQLSEE